jgi:hypothetical protein
VTIGARTAILGVSMAILVASLWALLPFTTAEAARLVLAFDAVAALVIAVLAQTPTSRGPDASGVAAAASAELRRIGARARPVDPRVAHVLSVRRAARIRHAELVA